MGTARNQASSKPCLLRKLVSAAAIYALIVQALLFSISATQFAQASAFDDVSLSQLCLHQTDGSPAQPVDRQSGNHCFVCSVAAFHLLGPPGPTIVSPINPEMRPVRQSALPHQPGSRSQYTVARPRGPPVSA
jgi:hypothetical protein